MSKKTLTIVGVLGLVLVVCCVACFIIIWGLQLTGVRKANEAADDTEVRLELSKISIAVTNYCTSYGRPPKYLSEINYSDEIKGREVNYQSVGTTGCEYHLDVEMSDGSKFELGSF